MIFATRQEFAERVDNYGGPAECINYIDLTKVVIAGERLPAEIIAAAAAIDRAADKIDEWMWS